MESKRTRILFILADIIIMALSFLFMAWLKPATVRYYLPSHAPFFGLLALLWLVVSFINGKMNRGLIVNLKSLFFRVISSNIIALGLAITIVFVMRRFFYSRMVVFGTVLLVTVLELIAGIIYLAVRKAIVQESELLPFAGREAMPTEVELVGAIAQDNNCGKGVDPELAEALRREAGEETAAGILTVLGGKAGGSPAIVSTGTAFNISGLPGKLYGCIINLRRMNDIAMLDSFLDTVNGKLRKNGCYLCCVETKNKRKERLMKKNPPVINAVLYFFHFLYHRIFAKLRLTRGMYLSLTGGKNRVLSRAEALGRLCRAGFRIENEAFIGNLLFIMATKISEPLNGVNQSYGMLIALNRIGRGGRPFRVYKLRTMYPYSEYLQEYVYNLYELKEGGKFRNDFRITTWGALCRKIWLDELPMIINLFQGDMKIVGVRPLSLHYYELYSAEMQERRIKYKPGLLPPYYADMPASLEEIQESEKRYLDAYDRQPLLTDMRYFFRSVWNILFRHARSN